MEEIWKDIKGYEGLYQVSNLGRVFSKKRNRMLKLIERRGYYIVGLRKTDKQIFFCVHSLVAECFLENPLNIQRVTHIDNNKKNNNANNLAFILVYGVGIYDVPRSASNVVAYDIWSHMIRRCYDKKEKRSKFYKDCTICDSWLRFSNFLKWFNDASNGYVKGYHLDKDLFSRNNKVYSPNTCCFLPQEINSALVFHRNKEGEMPLGVYFLKDSNVYLGVGENRSLKRFKTAEEAHNHYVKYKTKRIKELAEKYKDVITERVYNALLNYELPEDLTPDGVQMKAM